MSTVDPLGTKVPPSPASYGLSPEFKADGDPLPELSQELEDRQAALMKQGFLVVACGHGQGFRQLFYRETYP